jgi:hypothetical protein
MTMRSFAPTVKYINRSSLGVTSWQVLRALARRRGVFKKSEGLSLVGFLTINNSTTTTTTTTTAGLIL